MALMPSSLDLLIADGTTMGVEGMTPVVKMFIAGCTLRVDFVVVDELGRDEFLQDVREKV